MNAMGRGRGQIASPSISIVASKPSEKKSRWRGFAIDLSFRCRDFASGKINGRRLRQTLLSLTVEAHAGLENAALLRRYGATSVENGAAVGE